MQHLANFGYLNKHRSLFDYGCGLGSDVRELQAHGLKANGWDPVHAPESPKLDADIVNLGFVINVIESPQSGETCFVMLTDMQINSWLSQRCWVVAASPISFNNLAMGL